jgi:hypothetical protein
MSYENDLQIDEYELVLELKKQPNLVYKYSKEAAKAAAKFLHSKESLTLVKAEAKKELDRAQAEVELKIRSSDPVIYGLEKFTESTISALIKKDRQYLQAQETYNETVQGYINEMADLAEQSDVLQGAVQAIVHKRGSLENLVKLFLASYYGDPSVDNAGLERAAQTSQRTEQTQAMRERRRLKDRK